MTLVLELTPETEAFLANEARALGTSPEKAAAAALAELAAAKRKAARIAAWRQVGSYTNRQDAELPPLSHDAMERESIYEGRGE